MWTTFGGATETPQDDAKATYAKKIERGDAQVVWSAPATDVERLIRAFDPKPGAWTTRGDAEVRLFGARTVASYHGTPGTILTTDDDGMIVACGQGAVRVQDVHPADRKRQRAAEWMRGRGAVVGDVLGT